MRRSDFNYALPERLIAQAPTPERSASRLLVLGPENALEDRGMRSFPELVAPEDLLVFNDTRVVPARLLGRKRPSGGKVEVFMERLLGGDALLAQVRASKPPRVGSSIDVEGSDQSLTVVGREEAFYHLRVADGSSALALLETAGHIPLPPYIQRSDDKSDRERYQTLFAQDPGAVAAPTAGLHFDEALLDALSAKGILSACVTLHVGAGTFQPMRTEMISDHVMHAERYKLSTALVTAIEQTKKRGGRIIAIGTTVVRALESAALAAENDTGAGGLVAGHAETRIFITPGFRFRVVDALLTNFHLPGSTLLMLVSAFAGHARVMRAYAHAVESGYRFFSYGDAMFLPARAPSN